MLIRLILALQLILTVPFVNAEPVLADAPDVRIVRAEYGGELELLHWLHSGFYASGLVKVGLAVGFGVAAVNGLVQGDPGHFLGNLFTGALYLSFFSMIGSRLDRNTSESLIGKLEAEILKVCGDCQVHRVPTRTYGTAGTGVRFEYPDGWWFELSPDQGVIEIKNAKSTVEMLVRNRDRLQHHLYDVARKLRIKPERTRNRTGATHINIGLSAFENDARLLRNFFVDFHNHPELATGVWQDDQKNAPALALSRKKRDAFAKTIAKFDALPEAEQDVETLIVMLQEEVKLGKHYTDLSLRNAGGANVETRRLELRAMLGMSDADQFIFFTDLLDKRLTYLANQGGLVEFNNRPPPSSTAEKVANYRRYVEEAGASWEMAAAYLPGSLCSALLEKKKIKN